jgi:5S rRNA maturation endonuclease (ribonuclease M5)
MGKVGFRRDRGEVLEELGLVLREAEDNVDMVLVEGTRDAEALKRLGYRGQIEVISRCETHADIVEEVAERGRRVLILSDFDREGRRINREMLLLLESRGVRVECEMRRRIGRLMAILGTRAVEDLDNLAGI